MRTESMSSVSISSRRSVRINSEGRPCTYIMEFHPLEKKFIETNQNGMVTEYIFDFNKWRKLAKTNLLGAKLWHLYYRDILGNPKKQSMDLNELEHRYSISQKEISKIILEVNRAVCDFRLIKSSTE